MVILAQRLNITDPPEVRYVFPRPREAAPGFARNRRRRRVQGEEMVNCRCSTTLLYPFTAWYPLAGWQFQARIAISTEITCTCEKKPSEYSFSARGERGGSIRTVLFRGLFLIRVSQAIRRRVVHQREGPRAGFDACSSMKREDHHVIRQPMRTRRTRHAKNVPGREHDSTEQNYEAGT
jgi:hypothetical protein